MRQRVMIAMALAAEPEVVIMDEPTTGLDVVVQREILREIFELKAALGFYVLFITHDLSLLLEIADQVLIMYAGQVVESAGTAAIRGDPRPSLHAGPAGVIPATPRPPAETDRDPRHAARPAGRPARVPVRATVRPRHRRVRGRRHATHPVGLHREERRGQTGALAPTA